MVIQKESLNQKQQDALTMLSCKLFSGPLTEFNRLGIRTLVGKKLTQIGPKHRFDVSIGTMDLIRVDFFLDASGIAIVIDNGDRKDSAALYHKINQITQNNSVNALLLITNNHALSLPEHLNNKAIQLFFLNFKVPTTPLNQPACQGVPLNLFGSLRCRFLKK